MPPLSTPRVIELTPAGRAAVAVVLVAGPRARDIVDGCLHRADGRRLGDWPVGRILVARWGSPDGEELVVCRRADDAVEVHCHGGAAAIGAVIDRLVHSGCERLNWRDWLRQTAPDPICAAAQLALAEAPTARTASILLDQYEGALARAIHQIMNCAKANDWTAAIEGLEALLARRGVGLHLTNHWRIVLAGRPNVGKSSLLNALVGFQRAIVADLPGTTRDVVTATTAIDGWPVQLADTAGLRDGRDGIESAGVARATAAAAEADLVLFVDDAQGGDDPALAPDVPVLRVLNKIDLPQTNSKAARRRFDVETSATTGAGIAALIAAIGKALVPTPPLAGEAVPFTREQVAIFGQALAAARKGDAATVANRLQALVG